MAADEGMRLLTTAELEAALSGKTVGEVRKVERVQLSTHSDTPAPSNLTEKDLPSSQPDNIRLPSDGGPTQYINRRGNK